MPNTKDCRYEYLRLVKFISAREYAWIIEEIAKILYV